MKIKELRIKNGVTLRELGARTGIHFTQISRYETGKIIPKIKNLKILAKALDSTLDYLCE